MSSNEQEIPVQARLIDVPPTLLAMLGAEIPPEWQGVSLLPQILAESREYNEPVVAEGVKTGHWQIALYEKGWKLLVIRNPEKERKLYRIDTDPLEQEDLSGQHPDIVEKMVAQLQEIQQENEEWRSMESPEIVPLSEEQAQQLRALGYIK